MDEALKYGVYGCAAVIIGCFLLGLVTGEHSWVDRLWSLAPPLYVAWFASVSGCGRAPGVDDARVRLGRASPSTSPERADAGGEDYRWPILRRMTGWQWQLFAFGFVAGGRV
jgi:steroid 5-alpha reductase family enzyme